MQLMKSMSKNTESLIFFCRFSPRGKRLLSFCILVVCLFLVIIEKIYTKKIHEAPDPFLKVELRHSLINIVNSSDPKYPLSMQGPYHLENTTFCSSGADIIVLTIVLSSAKNFINRHVIRQTWANGDLFSDYGTVRTLFLLGRTDNATVETQIQHEFRLFADIVQGNFEDSLWNLTHKSIMGYNWVRKRCKNAKYIIKTDDDVVVNMFEIIQNRVLETSLKNHHVLCNRLDNSFVIRDTHTKFDVGPNQFRGFLFYPPYCNGQFVAMVNEVVPYLYEAAIRTPYFWIDDIHMYGLSMNNILALKYKQLEEEEMGTLDDIKSVECLKQKNKRCRTLYFVTPDSTLVVHLWSALFSLYR